MVTPDKNKDVCPLCESTSTDHFEQIKGINYSICLTCNGIYMQSRQRLDKRQEQKRYLEHNNDINDIKYQKFVSPITNSIMSGFSNKAIGLDFGAGTGPVIKKILEDNHYNITVYDPYFHKNEKALTLRYDFIACCEVIEHFYNPRKEFALLKKLLLPDGKLFCMTEIYNENIDFKQWYYKNDPTHVFFYHKSTFDWIKHNYKFRNLSIENRLIIFEN